MDSLDKLVEEMSSVPDNSDKLNFNPPSLYRAPNRKPLVSYAKLYLEDTGKISGTNGNADFNLNLIEFERSQKVKLWVNQLYADMVTEGLGDNAPLTVEFSWHQNNAWSTASGGKTSSVVVSLPGNNADAADPINENYYRYSETSDNYTVLKYDDQLRVTWRDAAGNVVDPDSWNMFVTMERVQ